MANPLRTAFVASSGETLDPEFCEKRNAENFRCGASGFWYRVEPHPTEKASGLGWVDLRGVVLNRKRILQNLRSEDGGLPANADQIVSAIFQAKTAHILIA